MQICVGIDYSLTSPSVCVNQGSFPLHHTWMVFQKVKPNPNVVQLHPSKKEEKGLDRCHFYAYNIISYIKSLELKLDTKDIQILIEGYSYGSKGKVFDIAEGCGILKYQIWKNGWVQEVIPPATLKKYATGNGRADKIMMIEQFKKDTLWDLNLDLVTSKKIDAKPIPDMVDAYYLCRYCHAKKVK